MEESQLLLDVIKAKKSEMNFVECFTEFQDRFRVVDKNQFHKKQ